MSKSPPPIRAADRALFATLFTSVAEEMGGTLARTSYSPNIKERRDFSCALFDHDRRLLAQAAHIPVHLGALPASVDAAVAACGPLREGDVVVLNDPYAGGTHLPDITLVTCLTDRRGAPRFYLATRAHHADVGGMTPGSLPPSTELVQEGFRIPPLKWRDRGTLNETLRELLLANVRTPREREGDLRAQEAAHTVGATRLRELLDRYGPATLRTQADDLLHYGEALMRDTLSRIPDGTTRFRDALDPWEGETLAIEVKITIRKHRATVDFTGTSPASRGSLNAVESITRSAVYYAFLCLLVTPEPGSAATGEAPPINAGCFLPITVKAPRGSLVNATPPHAVAGGNVETSQRIVDVVFGALAKALPRRIPAASQGTMNNLTLGGVDPRTDTPFAYYETLGGGMGGGPDQPGDSAIQVHMTNTLNTPVEALEYAYPFRVERYGVAPGTGGTGAHRGGQGAIREVRLLARATGALLTNRRDQGPYGLQGGQPGAPGRNELIRKGKRIPLLPSCPLDLQPGDLLRIQTPGGGGWGEKC